jgi:hypothetical protein
MRITINRHANDPRSAFSRSDAADAEQRQRSDENHRARNEAAAADAKAIAEVTRRRAMARKGLPCTD